MEDYDEITSTPQNPIRYRLRSVNSTIFELCTPQSKALYYSTSDGLKYQPLAQWEYELWTMHSVVQSLKPLSHLISVF